MLKLYAIADDIRSVLAVLNDPATEDPDQLAKAVRETLEALDLERQFDRKALSVSCFIKELEAELTAVQDNPTQRRPPVTVVAGGLSKTPASGQGTAPSVPAQQSC